MAADKRFPEAIFLEPKALLAMISCHVAGLFFLPLMPLLLGALAKDFSVTSLELGIIGSLQLGFTAVGAILLSKMGAGYSCKALVSFAIFVELLVNISCVLSDSIASISILRVVSGMTQGMLLSAASAGAAISRKAEYVFVYYNATLAVFAVAGLMAGAWTISYYGYRAGFLLFVAVDVMALILIHRGFPEFKIKSSNQYRGAYTQKTKNPDLKAFISLTLFGAALAGSQTFIGHLGEWRGGSIQTIGISLAIGWCLAVGSPFLVLPIVRRWGGVKPLMASYFLVAICAITMSITETLFYFLVVAALFTPAALFVEPLQFGVLGAIDPSGRLAALGPAALSIGSGSGPVLAGVAVKLFGLTSIGILAGFLLLCSLAIFFPVANMAYKNRFL